MAKKPSLTVVIPTYNRAKSLKNCLGSLVEQTDKDFDVFIIDGGSLPKTMSVIKKFKKDLPITLLVDETPHLAYIRDLGWRKAKGEIVASIDDDVVVDKSWVASIKRIFGDRKVGGVTGPTVIPEKLLTRRDVFLFYTTQSMILKLLAQVYFRLFLQGERDSIGKIYPCGAWSPGSNFPSSKKLKRAIKVDYLEACNYAIPQKVLKEIGGYDLRYIDTSEWCEVDVAFRIRKAGYKLLFDPKVAVEHRVSKGGVFSHRANARARMENFLRFYLCSYYPKTLGGYLQFLLYLQFLNLYWIILFLRSGNIAWLGGILGNFTGAIAALRKG